MDTRLLIVDDDQDTLEVMRRNLALPGYQVAVASGGEEALVFLRGTRVDLLVTDLKMPRASGWDLVRQVRERHPETEILVVSGYLSSEPLPKAGEPEGNFLAKPFTEEELRQAVERALACGRARRGKGPSGEKITGGEELTGRKPR